MTRHTFLVAQLFDCTYVVEANTREEGWSELMDGEGDCHEQFPGPIISSLEESDES